MPASTPGRITVSVLACTYNRAGDLREMLESVLAQSTHPTDGNFEVVVVDNNSTDRTREVVEEKVRAGHSNVKYLFEGRQGRSYALNTGLAAVEGEFYAIVDDDLVLPPDYLATVLGAFRSHPGVACVGGKVLPRCPTSPEPGVRHRPTACPTSAKSAIGGTEDADLFERLYAAGKKGLYWPSASVFHKVESVRLTRNYHRRWHLGHGRYTALMRDPAIERSRRHLLGIPGHLVREAVRDVARWLGSLGTGNRQSAFEAELRLRFFAGFASARLGQRRSGASAAISRSS